MTTKTDDEYDEGSDEGYVDFTVDHINPDPVQYKPYSPSFSPATHLVVRVPLDSEYVIQSGDVTVIDLAGFQTLLATLADAIDEMDSDRRGSKSKVKSPFSK